MYPSCEPVPAAQIQQQSPRAPSVEQYGAMRLPIMDPWNSDSCTCTWFWRPYLLAVHFWVHSDIQKNMLFMVICIYLDNPLHAIAWNAHRFDHPTHLQNNFPLALPALLLNRFGQLAAISSCCVLALSLPAEHARGNVKTGISKETYTNKHKQT